MLNFQAVREKEMSFDELVYDLSKGDLEQLTNEIIDTILGLIADCEDEDVQFLPNDPEAYDPFAEEEKDINLAWTLGHVIVHINASNEESAVLASELARGVEYHGRSRSEIPWELIRTVDECRRRLEESRRMCLASLNMWPDEPHLDNYYQSRHEAPRINAIGRYIYGLFHADSHFPHIQSIIHQAKESRS
jgi:hypothetical protein